MLQLMTNEFVDGRFNFCTYDSILNEVIWQSVKEDYDFQVLRRSGKTFVEDCNGNSLILVDENPDKVVAMLAEILGIAR